MYSSVKREKRWERETRSERECVCDLVKIRRRARLEIKEREIER